MAFYSNMEPWGFERTVTYAERPNMFAAAATVSPDRRFLVMGYSDASLRLFAMDTGLPVLALPPLTSPIKKLFISPDGKRVAAGTQDDSLYVWDAANGNKLLELHTIELLGGFSSDSRDLLVRTSRLSRNSAGPIPAFSGDLISLLDVTSGECAAVPNTDHCKSAFCFPTGHEIAVLRGDGTLQVIDAGGRTQLLDMGQNFVTFSPDGLRMLTGSLDFQSVNEWDMTEIKRRLVLSGHTGATTAAHYSIGMQTILTTGSDGKAKVWDAASGALLSSFEIGTKILPEPGAFYTDPTHAMVLNANGSAAVWHRRRQESEAGIMVLPEFWLLLGFFGALLWSIARDQTEERALQSRRISLRLTQ